MKKKSAFTLTEVLITLSIIGIISALTVPDLMKNYQKEAQEVQIRKASQEFANAIDMYITEQGKSTLAGTDIFNDIDSFVTSYLKTTKTCEKNDEDNTTNSCFAGTSYRAISGQSSTMSCSEKSYVLANSSSICVTAFTNGEDTNSSARPYLKVIMDSNGSEKPNIGGRDMFTFYIDRTGTLRGDKPEKDDDDDNTGSTNSCTTSAVGEGCLTKLEENNWKMVY